MPQVLANPQTAVREALQMQAYRMGYKDGTKSMLRGSKCNNPSYMSGYLEGLKFYCCDLPSSLEAPMERGWGDELLNEI